MSGFFFNDTATTESYTLSLHDALPIYIPPPPASAYGLTGDDAAWVERRQTPQPGGVYEDPRSEEHTSELQSRQYVVCRLLLEKKRTFFMPTPRAPAYAPLPSCCTPITR